MMEEELKSGGHQGHPLETMNVLLSPAEYMNNVLASGEVSNLFARDELDDITQDLIPVMKQQHPRRPPTSENLYDFFLSRVRSNLHVVLCFSPVGEKFRTRALKVSCITCDRSFTPAEMQSRHDSPNLCYC